MTDEHNAEACKQRGFHKFVMGYVGCVDCAAPDPNGDRRHIVDIASNLRDTRACRTCGGFRLFTARLLNRDYCRKCDPEPQALPVTTSEKGSH